MNQDFDYMREMDPRAKDYYVVYPRVKLWHVLAVVLAGLLITHYMLQHVMGSTAQKKLPSKKLL